MRALLACIVLAMPLHSPQAQTADAPATLAALRDQARPLLIFAGPNDSRVEQQYADLASHAQDMRERDMRVALLTASRTRMHDGNRPPEVVFAPDEQQRLRRRFHIAPGDFAVVLIGKDGGEKLRASNPISWAKLAATVDAMPMRREEMRAR